MSERYEDRPARTGGENGVGDVARLKSILFRNEQKALTELRTQLEAHHARIGSDTEMRQSVSTILAGALHDARVEDHDQVADAIAPLIVQGMKQEIKNSRDDMVDALYPIMGRLVSAYVSAAVSDAMEQTNRRLETGLSGKFLYLRAKSLLTGTPYAELAMAESRQFQMGELMLIRRGSGLLLDHLSLDVMNADQKSRSAEKNALVSGVVAAIHDFAQEAFSERKNSLRSVDMGDQTIFLRATPGLIFAVIGRGKPSRKFERALDAELLHILETRHEDIDRLEDQHSDAEPKILPLVADHLSLIQKEAGGGKPVLALLLVGLIGASIAAFTLWSIYETRQLNALRTAVASSIEAEPDFAGYPVQFDVSPDRSFVRVSGFAPSRKAQAALESRIGEAIGSSRLKAAFTLIGPNDGLLNRVAGAEQKVELAVDQSDQVRRQVESSFAKIDNQIDESVEKAVARLKVQQPDFDSTDLEKSIARVDQGGRRSLEERVTPLQERLAVLEEKINGPRVRLDRWVTSRAIFFTDGTSYRDRRRVAADLAELIRRATTADARIRVVGYADARGTAKANERLATDRAVRVRDDLVARGFPRRRLVAVGRSGQRQFSDQDGPASGNRRVEFEVLLDGE